LRSVSRNLAIAAGLLLLIVTAYWKLALPGPSYVWFDQYDMCQLEVPRLQFLARSLHEGHFSLWDPNIWAGLPVIGVGQPGPIYPLNVLFFALPLEYGRLSFVALNWLFIAFHFVDAVFFYVFCRDNRIGRLAAAFGALAFSCAGYVGGVPWLDIGNGLTWTPLIFLFALRLWTGRISLRNASLLGAVLGVSWLSGHHEIPLLNSYAVLLGTLILVLFRLAKTRSFDYRLPVLVMFALFLAAAISAVQTLPLWEFGREASRWVGTPEPIDWQTRVPYSIHAQYSLGWKAILGLLIPGGLPTIFVGFSVSILALLGVLFGRSERWLFLTATVGLAGLVYSLGVHTPVHHLLYQLLPMLDKARNPFRGMFLVTFAMSVLAAFGANRLLAHLPRFRSIAGGALIALLLLEVSRVSGRRITALDPAHSVCANEMLSHQDLVAQLRQEPALGRITVNSTELMTNLGDLYGFGQLQSFVAGAPANVLRHELHTAKTERLFGVTNHIGKEPTAPEDRVIATYDKGLRLFRKPDALPPAWVTHEILRVANDEELRRAIQNPTLDLRKTAVVLETVPSVESCPASEDVDVFRPNTDAVILRAKLQCRGLVVLSDTFYPGWKATVDGRRAEIYEVYGAFRGVLLEAGEHTVRMDYRPVSVRLGSVITGFAVLIVLVIQNSDSKFL
jgi:hypothetical protein